MVVSAPETVLVFSEVIRSRSMATSPPSVTGLGRYNDTVSVGRWSGAFCNGNAPGIAGSIPPVCRGVSSEIVLSLDEFAEPYRRVLVGGRG